MVKYEKPTVLLNEELSEGVYTDSGCYTIKINMHQKPQTGRGDYRIQVNAQHDADHSSDSQTLVISFNMPVEFVEFANGRLASASPSTTLTFSMNYHQNPTDNIGAGDIVVKADQGLEVTGIVIYD